MHSKWYWYIKFYCAITLMGANNKADRNEMCARTESQRQQTTETRKKRIKIEIIKTHLISASTKKNRTRFSKRYWNCTDVLLKQNKTVRWKLVDSRSKKKTSGLCESMWMASNKPAIEWPMLNTHAETNSILFCKSFLQRIQFTRLMGSFAFA